ncbi:MAG: ribose 5-phosphate isomerase B [Elusimicrobia bacterium]|nr:ribose 5-phosphate isomerase B [Elusimicrobiota bacterium]
MAIKKIAVGADHAGWKLKETLARFLKRRKVVVIDAGTHQDTARVDYPDYAKIVARAVAAGKADIGILCCGTGIGMSIAANKIRRTRAAVVWNKKSAALAREHNGANIVCFGARLMSERAAEESLDVFLKTTPSKESRHRQRIAKIAKLEQ